MILLTALAFCSVTFAQQPRIFTYDALGNRIAMQITSENAPEASLFNADDTMDEDTASFDVTETTGIVSVSLKGWTEGEPVRISLYTTAGQQITETTTKLSDMSFNITAHPAGVYIVEVRQGDKHVARKFTKEE